MNAQNKKAKEFLDSIGVKCTIIYAGPMAPPWGENTPHGRRFCIVMRRNGANDLIFDFWNSQIACQGHGKTFLEREQFVQQMCRDNGCVAPYFTNTNILAACENPEYAGALPGISDILECIISESDIYDTFKDFCLSFGYDEDSISATETFKRSQEFARKINEFFTADEIERMVQCNT